MFLKKLLSAIVNFPLMFQSMEQRMKKAAYANIVTIQELVRSTYAWNPDQPSHRGSTMTMMRKELRNLLSRPHLGTVDMYSKVRLEHYEHPQGSEHGYYEIVVRDDRDNWTVLPLMLMLNFKEREYYLVTSSQVQGPVCQSSIIEA